MTALPEGLGVRALQDGEEGEWLRLRQVLWPECEIAIHEHEMRLLQALRPRSAVFVVSSTRPDDAGRLLGFVELSVRDYAEACHGERIGYVEGWYVSPLWRGQRVGAALMLAGEAWARDAGCTVMASDTGIENVASQRAHTRLGFEDVGQLVHFRKAL